MELKEYSFCKIRNNGCDHFQYLGLIFCKGKEIEEDITDKTKIGWIK